MAAALPPAGAVRATSSALTHIVDGAVVATKEEEGASSVVAVDGDNILDLREGWERSFGDNLRTNQWRWYPCSPASAW